MIIRTILVAGLLLGGAASGQGQSDVTMDDFGRIVLNAYVPDELQLPSQAHSQLENKLNQISTRYGMGGNSADGRFVMMAVVNVLSKDIIAGPPQMVAQNFEITFYIGDALEDKLFSSDYMELKGVGKNENQSLINALKGINSGSPAIASMMEQGKNRIIAYFESNCDFIIKNALALDAQGQYDQAIFNLISVPEVCKDCYFKCLDTLEMIYQHKIDRDCEARYNDAKALWAVQQNKENAFRVAEIISEIDPYSSCMGEVNTLVASINQKLRAAERQEWEWKMKQYNDNLEFRRADVDLEKMRIEAYRQIGVEQAKHVRRIKIKNKSLFGVNIGSGFGKPF